MANQIVVSQSGNVQVVIEPTPNVQVNISRAAITTVTNVNTANYANFAGNVVNANQPNITGVGTLGNLSVSGTATIGNAVITGNLSVGNLIANSANYANFAGQAFNVNVANVTGLGNIAVVNLNGSNSNVLLGDGNWGALPSTANANYANFAGTAFNVSGSNVSGTVANANYSAYAGNATIANSANSVAGANVSGEVAYAAVANSVAVANVSGIGNIAITNYDGNGSNILHGNGFWGPEIGPQSVANANYANFAGTAYSVSGSNVVGDVSGANHANVSDSANSVAGANVTGQVGYAAVANSVALANVSGAGNIASINLDGNVSNALLGNGSWGPVEVQSTSIANGTSNVTIPVANAQILFATGGNSNVAVLNNGQLSLNPQSNVNNGLVINGYGSNPLGDMWRISSFRYRGTNTAPLSVNPNDATMRFLTTGSNGTALQTNSVATFTARVDSSYVANGANIPLGWQLTVNDTNGGINNQSKIHNFYSNGNVSFANSVIVNNDITVTNGNANINANITSIGGAFYGNGIGLTNLTGSNVTGTVANANYATYAGTANIANATANLANLIVNSGNVELPIYQVQPTHNLLVGNTSNLTLSPYAYRLTQDYGNGQNDGNLALPGNDSYIKYRGNSASPAAVSQNDRINKSSYYGYNGTANILSVTTDTRVANTNTNANAVWSGGSYNITTGNPLGDIGNANAISAYNSYQMDQYGRFIITPATAPTGITNGGIVVNNYGGTGAGGMQALVFNRYRGNRDGNLSVQPNDQVGGMTFLAYNGNAVATNRVAQIRAQVDGSYTPGNANIPMYLNFSSCNDTTQWSTRFNTDGSWTMPGNILASGNNYIFSSSNTSIPTTVYIGGDKTPNSQLNLSDTQFSVTLSNVDISTGFSPFRFQQYSSLTNQCAPWYMYRARGTAYPGLPVLAGDQIFAFNFITNSNNTTTSVGSFSSTVNYNDNAGNVGSTLTLSALGSGTTGAQNGLVDIFAANTNLSGNILVSGDINYTKVYGQFEYTTTVTPAATNTAYVFPLGSTIFTSVATVGSTSRLIPGKGGYYNLQFSVQVNNADNGSDHTAYIWLRKNGTDVAGSMGRITVTKGGATIAGWNYLIDPSNSTDYFELAYAVDDTQVTFPAYGSTAFGPSTATLITTLTPVGA